MDKLFTIILLFVLYPPLLFVLGLATAWVPMLGWNLGLHKVFPNIIPEITYFQAFWLTVLSGWIVHRPQVHTEK